MDDTFAGAGKGGAGAGGERGSPGKSGSMWIPAPSFLLLHSSCSGGSWAPLGGEVVLKYTFILCNPPRDISAPRSPTGHVQTLFPSDEPTTSGRCMWVSVWLSLGVRHAFSWDWLEEDLGCGPSLLPC